MKRFARLLVFSAAAVAAVFAGGAPQSFTGVIHSNQCAGPACATQCPISKDPVYTLQTEDRVWVLSDPKTAASLAGKFAGRQVTITGTTQGNTLKIDSVQPVR